MLKRFDQFLKKSGHSEYPVHIENRDRDEPPWLFDQVMRNRL
jgi:hypothetical protein